MAQTSMPACTTSDAATSSWVDSGLLAHRRTCAPPAAKVRARFAVSDVTCRQAARRKPRRGFSLVKRSRMLPTTGICASAQRIRVRPLSARARSFTSEPFPSTCRPFPAARANPSDPMGLADRFGLIGLFPGELRIAPPEVPEGRGAPVDRPAQVERIDDLARLQPEVLANQLRSEEHTSELQSRLHLVCRLLLEKKKT